MYCTCYILVLVSHVPAKEKCLSVNLQLLKISKIVSLYDGSEMNLDNICVPQSPFSDRPIKHTVFTILTP